MAKNPGTSKPINRRVLRTSQDQRNNATEREPGMSDDKIKLAAKVETRVKERDKLSLVIQSEIDSLAEKIGKLIDHDLKTYSMLTNPDCLYYDSPVSRAFTYEWIKQYMIKKDLDFVGHFFDGKVNILSFSERMTDASKWMMRFTKEPEKQKTGIEAIL